MEEIFIAVMEKLNADVPELSLVDEDYGQLELPDGTDAYPVTFPCVLIGETETVWSDLKPTCQRGNTLFSVKLAIDYYDDTHFSSGTYDLVRERMALCRKVFKALQGLKVAGSTALSRVKSASYTAPGGIKVYDMTFAFRVSEML